jgi:hypothetical protein
MRGKPVTIIIDPDNELGRALAEGGGEPFVLVRGAARIRVTRDADDPWAAYDSETVLGGLYEIAGTPSPAEGARMKALICRGCEEGTRLVSYLFGASQITTG